MSDENNQTPQVYTAEEWKQELVKHFEKKLAEIDKKIQQSPKRLYKRQRANLQRQYDEVKD